MDAAINVAAADGDVVINEVFAHRNGFFGNDFAFFRLAGNFFWRRFDCNTAAHFVFRAAMSGENAVILFVRGGAAGAAKDTAVTVSFAAVSTFDVYFGLGKTLFESGVDIGASLDFFRLGLCFVKEAHGTA